jgi:hypothetical protein
MVTVYWQDDKQRHTEKIATFEDENLYMACLPIIKALGETHRLNTIESLD